MQLILAALFLLAAALPAQAQQSAHRHDLFTMQSALRKYYDKYGALYAQQQLATTNDCLFKRSRGGRYCDETVGEAAQAIRELEANALGLARMDYPAAALSLVGMNMTLAQIVEVLHTNQDEIRVILDAYAGDGK